MSWIADQKEKIENLVSQVVFRYIVNEMAFRGGAGNARPEFEHPELPFIQAGVLYLELDSGLIKFITYQNDDKWGIYLTEVLAKWEPKIDPGAPDSIYRTRELTSYPTGQITSVDVMMDPNGDISEVLLDFADDSILLIAGEVYEGLSRELRVIKGDESICIFRNPKLKNDVEFSTSII